MGMPILGIIFSFYVAFCVFAVMNVVTGVFVQQALGTAEEDGYEVLVNEMCALFDTESGEDFDITWDAFKNTLDTTAMKEYFKALYIDKAEARRLFELLDADGSGTVDRNEFIAGLVRLRGQARAL